MASIEEAQKCLRQARSILVLTGAGISKASGIPVYRGEEGSVYEDPAQLQRAMGKTLRDHPEQYWRDHAALRARLAAAAPNPAHRALVRIEAQAERFLLVTQNIDNLHRRAGSHKTLELHGNAFYLRCSDDICPASACRDESDPAEGAVISAPRCPLCKAVQRPDLVLFGEADESRWQAIEAFAELGVELVLLIGTSGVVPVPTALLDRVEAAGSQPTVITINPAPAPAIQHRSNLWLRLGASEALSQLAEGLESEEVDASNAR